MGLLIILVVDYGNCRNRHNCYNGSLFLGETKMTQKPLIRVALVNRQTLHARCGHGVGKTREEALKDALRIAHSRDDSGDVTIQNGEVWYNGGINC